MKIDTLEKLQEHYDNPSGRAKNKQLDFLDAHAINFINHSPFVIISTHNQLGKSDTSPKGGVPGFVKITNNKQLIIPDSKGNNRLDGLINIIETGAISLLFLIPGIDETLRVNGKAMVSTEKKLLEPFAEDKNPPKTVILITVEEMFLHCAKALMRSKLWSEDYKISRPEFPTMGKMLHDQLKSSKPFENQEEMLKRYEKDL